MSANLKSSARVGKRLSVSMGDFVRSLVVSLLAMLLIVAVIIGGAYCFVKNTHENSVLRSEIAKIEKEVGELEKCLQCRQAGLERQKNSQDIIATARKLGMRPAYSNNICYLPAEKKEQQNLTHPSLAQFNSPDH